MMCRARVPSANGTVNSAKKPGEKPGKKSAKNMKIIVVVDGVVPAARLVIGCPQTKDGWGGWTVEQLKKVGTHASSESQPFT